VCPVAVREQFVQEPGLDQGVLAGQFADSPVANAAQLLRRHFRKFIPFAVVAMAPKADDGQGRGLVASELDQQARFPVVAKIWAD